LSERVYVRRIAFPDANLPGLVSDVADVSRVLASFLADFVTPVVEQLGGEPPLAAVETARKADAGQAYLVSRPEHEVELATSFASMEAVAVASAAHHPPDALFGAGVLLSDRGHRR